MLFRDRCDANSAKRPTLAFVGAGRVGSTLAVAAHRAGYEVRAVFTRSPERAQAVVAATGVTLVADLGQLARSADLIFLAVPDDNISAVDAAGAGAWQAGTGVVHHSGAHGAGLLRHAAAAGARTGALHPLQAITYAETALALLPGTYFGVSGDAGLVPTLIEFVRALGGHPLAVPDDAKPLYHAAAVFASNYVVTCLAQAVDLLAGLGIAAEDAQAALLPLAQGAVANLAQRGLPDALTGPISRGDVGTLAEHERLLASRAPALLPLYRALGAATVPVAAAQRRLPAEAIAALSAFFASEEVAR